MSSKKIRRLNMETHRDLGYFFTVLIIAYCISGIALNHIDNWNPDFDISKVEVPIPKGYTKEKINRDEISNFSRMAGEESYKIYDFPTPDQVKIYYDNSSMLVDLKSGIGHYEKVSRRPIFYQTNLLHRNGIKGWKWVADIFAVLLIVLSVTGLFILKGKHGIKGRGKWLVTAGALLPLIAVILHEL